MYRCLATKPLTRLPRAKPWNTLFITRRCTSTSSSSSLPLFDPSPKLHLTQNPSPSWKLGTGMPSDTAFAREWKAQEEQGWKSWEADKTSPVEMYKMLSSAITPRPIAFVSTIAPDGVRNLAPFSFFNMVAFLPPLVSVSTTLSPRRPKDTRENILVTKEFVLNLISEPFAEAANATSVEAPAEVDEWIVSGLTEEPSMSVKPGRVRESAVSLECELYSYQDIYPDGTDVPSTTISLGKVKIAHVRNAVLQPDGLQLDPAKLRVISRLGGNTYARLGEGFDIARPSWKEVKKEMGDKL